MGLTPNSEHQSRLHHRKADMRDNIYRHCFPSWHFFDTSVMFSCMANLVYIGYVFLHGISCLHRLCFPTSHLSAASVVFSFALYLPASVIFPCMAYSRPGLCFLASVMFHASHILPAWLIFA